MKHVTKLKLDLNTIIYFYRFFYALHGNLTYPFVHLSIFIIRVAMVTEIVFNIRILNISFTVFQVIV